MEALNTVLNQKLSDMGMLVQDGQLCMIDSFEDELAEIEVAELEPSDLYLDDDYIDDVEQGMSFESIDLFDEIS